MSAIFYQTFIFSLNDSPSKTVKNVFYLIWKVLFVLEIFTFLYFFPSFPHIPDSKWQMEVEWFMMSWIGLHKVADVIFEVTRKLLYIISSNLVRCVNNKGIFLNSFFNLKSDLSLVPAPFSLDKGSGNSLWCTFSAWFSNKYIPY